MDVHGTTKSVRRNSTPRNPKLNSVVACSREIRGARRGKLRPELPSCTCLYCQGPTARGWSVSLARFAPRAFSLLRCDFFPLSSLAVNIQSRAAHPARSRAELLEKFLRLRTMFQFSEHFLNEIPNDKVGRKKLDRNFFTEYVSHAINYSNLLDETQKCNHWRRH